MLQDGLKRDIVTAFLCDCQGKEYRGDKKVLFSILTAYDYFLFTSELFLAPIIVLSHLVLLLLLSW